MNPKNIICLWFNKDAEEAARFYAATFPDSEVTAVNLAPGDYPSGKEGEVITVEFTVIGIPCVSFPYNAEPKHLFGLLLKKVRATGASVPLPYRCDGPDCRRFIELEPVPTGAAEVEFRSRIVQQEFRAPVRRLEEVEQCDEILPM